MTVSSWGLSIVGTGYLLTRLVGFYLYFGEFIVTLDFLTLDQLCKKQQLLCVEDIGSWVRFPDTLHEGYGHLAEVMGKFPPKNWISVNC